MIDGVQVFPNTTESVCNAFPLIVGYCNMIIGLRYISERELSAALEIIINGKAWFSDLKLKLSNLVEGIYRSGSHRINTEYNTNVDLID